MADFTWKSPLAGVIQPGSHGARRQTPGVTIRELRRTLHSISPRKDQHGRVSEILQRHQSMALPEPGFFNRNGDSTLLWAGYNQWMLAGPPATTMDVGTLAEELEPWAALVEHGDGRAILRISGPSARDTLAKLCAVDLHPRRFTTGRCAATRLGHISALLHQTDDEPSFEIHVFRAFAASFYHELTEAAHEFGYSIPS